MKKLVGGTVFLAVLAVLVIAETTLAASISRLPVR